MRNLISFFSFFYLCSVLVFSVGVVVLIRRRKIKNKKKNLIEHKTKVKEKKRHCKQSKKNAILFFNKTLNAYFLTTNQMRKIETNSIVRHTLKHNIT